MTGARRWSHLGEITCVPLNTVGNKRISFVGRAEVHHRDVEQAVGVVGIGADLHAAAVAAGVAQRREGRVGNVSSPFEGEGQRRSWDSSATIARLYRIGPFGQHIRLARSVTSESNPRPSGAGPHLRAVVRVIRRGRPSRPPSTITSAAASGCRGDTEFARVVVAGAGRDQPERMSRSAGACNPSRWRRPRRHDERVGAARRAPGEQHARVIGVGPDDLETSTPRCWRATPARPRGCVAVPRQGVGQHGDRLDLCWVTESACRG